MIESRFYIKQLTSAEVGETKTHEKYIRLSNDFDYKTFFQNTDYVNGTVIQVDFAASDLSVINTESAPIPLRFVFYYNSNNEKRIPSLGDVFTKHGVKVNDVVCLESRSQNGTTSYFITFIEGKGVSLSSSSIYYTTTYKEPSTPSSEELKEAFHQYLLTPGLFRTQEKGESYWKIITSKRSEIQFLNDHIYKLFNIICDDIFVIDNYDDATKLWNAVKPDPKNLAFQNMVCSAILGKYKDFLQKYKVSTEIKQTIPPLDEPLQQIFYGAPGTGKSHKVDEMCKAYSNHRTTFHPDSDYSTFVGCYKPTKVKVDKKPLLNFNELADKLREYRTKDNETNAQVAFGYDYYQSLREVDNLGKLLLASGGAEYDTYLSAGMLIAKKEEGTKKAGDITYSFTPQAFTSAYVEAWQKFEKNEPVLLVIEEINRGNCAQIFGDLFQLLDRSEDGYSTYPIEPDTDLGTYISEQGLNVQNAILKKKDSTEVDISKDINEGKKLVLPPNLYIWATMNTSDQSLFPIDSAFKRRWDWKYVPIDTEKEYWAIEVNGNKYSWTSFLNIINEKIYEKTESEDKCLGFYFCKAKDKVISAEKFVGKVLFYLYQDVYKDYGFDEDYFKDEDGKTLVFRKYFKSIDKVDEAKVERLLTNLGVEPYNEGNE